jgi:hypothetical protein
MDSVSVAMFELLYEAVNIRKRRMEPVFIIFSDTQCREPMARDLRKELPITVIRGALGH